MRLAWYYRLHNRAVCALPHGAPRSVRMAGVRRLAAITVKRRLIRAALSLDAVAERSSWAEVAPLDMLPGLRGADRVLNEECGDTAYAAVYWPSELKRQRAYVHVMDGDGTPLGFVKWVGPTERESLRREQSALVDLGGGSMSLRTPRVLGAGDDLASGSSWLLTEPLPEAARAEWALLRNLYDSTSLLAAVRGTPRFVDGLALPTLSWWPALLQALPVAATRFRSELHERAKDGVQVCRTHGDLGPHNMMRERNMTWLFDWESSAPDGPLGADEVFRQFSGNAASTVLSAVRQSSSTRRCRIFWASAFGLAKNVGCWPNVAASWEFSISPRELG